MIIWRSLSVPLYDYSKDSLYDVEKVPETVWYRCVSNVPFWTNENHRPENFQQQWMQFLIQEKGERLTWKMQASLFRVSLLDQLVSGDGDPIQHIQREIPKGPGKADLAFINDEGKHRQRAQEETHVPQEANAIQPRPRCSGWRWLHRQAHRPGHHWSHKHCAPKHTVQPNLQKNQSLTLLHSKKAWILQIIELPCSTLNPL